MARKKIDTVYQEYYGKFLHGDSGRFLNNPANNRLALIERMYRRVLTELATNRFKWSGMPESVDTRFLELNLFYRAVSVFFKDTDIRDLHTGAMLYAGTDKFMALQASGTGNLNMYNNPTSFTLVGNQFTRPNPIRTADCEPIWANYLRVPDLDIVQIYSQRLAEIDLTIEINAKNLRRTKVLVYGENTKLSAENINRQIDEGQPTIRLSAPLGDMISALDLGIDPDAVTALHILKVRQWNECMGMLGINNANQDKKERLVADEVAANDDQVAAMRAVNLNARQDAARRIGKHWPELEGLDVCYHSDVDNQAIMPGVGGMPALPVGGGVR